MANDIGRDIHQVAADLRPTALDDLGLHDALRALVADWIARFHINLDLQFLGESTRFSSEIEIAVYRLIQEALTNILKHAQARNVSLLFERRPTELRVIVEDDGIGFDPSAAQSASEIGAVKLGLSGMRERMQFDFRGHDDRI